MSESISTTSVLKICHGLGIRLSTGPNFIFWLQMIVVNLMSFYSLYVRSDWHANTGFHVKDILVDYAFWLMELWYVNISFYLTYKRGDWSDLMKSMTMTQKRLFGNSSVKAHFTISKKFVIVFCIMLLAMTFDVIVFSFDNNVMIMLILTVCLRTPKLYKLLGIILARSCVDVFLDQIRFVRKRINRLNRFDTGSACEEIVEIAGICRSLQTSVEAFNKIFGWQLFAVFANYVSGVLAHMAVSTVITSGFTIPHLHLVVPVLYSLMDTILILLIALPGDKIEKGCEILEQECHEMIFGKLSRSQLKNELLTLSQSIKTTNLRISAAAFYDVNKSALLGLASVITTYFIVYLQFKN